MCFKGLPVKISVNIVFLLRIIFFILANNEEFKPDEMPHYGYYIWVFTVCQSTCLQVS